MFGLLQKSHSPELKWVVDFPRKAGKDISPYYHYYLLLCRKSFREVADQEFEAAKASFPSEEVNGEDEKLGMGTADKEFDTIRSFSWTFGGTGSVKIKKVQDVTLNKTPKINLEIEEVTGVFKCDNLANGNVTINKANILYMHDTCKSKVKVDDCNCLIILKDGSATEYTVGKVRGATKI